MQGLFHLLQPFLWDGWQVLPWFWQLVQLYKQEEQASAFCLYNWRHAENRAYRYKKGTHHILLYRANALARNGAILTNLLNQICWQYRLPHRAQEPKLLQILC